MKCKGKIKEKTKKGRTVERDCNNKLTEYQIFCDKCGEPTGALSGPLSAKQNYKEAWDQFNKVKSKFYPFSIFIILTAFLLIGLGILFSKNLAEIFKIEQYLFTNLMLLILVPFVFIPFGFKEDFVINHFTIGRYFRGLKYYPQFFLLTLVNILYFTLLKVICTGYKLGITIDPILHLVRLVLVLYWITIVFPSVILIIRKRVNAFKAIVLCYKASAETRWQQFFLVVRIFLYNVLGAALAGLGLLVTIPLSYVIIEKYYEKLDEFELFEKSRKKE